MKTIDMVNAHNTLELLSDALVDPKLPMKINRILRELRDEVKDFNSIQEKMQNGHNENIRKIALERGAKPVGNDLRLEDKVENDQMRFEFMEESRKIMETIKKLGEEEVEFSLKSQKISEKEIEEAKFKTEHNFAFSNMKFIENFLTG